MIKSIFELFYLKTKVCWWLELFWFLDTLFGSWFTAEKKELSIYCFLIILEVFLHCNKDEVILIQYAYILRTKYLAAFTQDLCNDQILFLTHIFLLFPVTVAYQRLCLLVCLKYESPKRGKQIGVTNQGFNCKVPLSTISFVIIRGVTIYRYIDISQYTKNLYRIAIRNSYRNISRIFFFLMKLIIFYSILVL